MSKVYFNFKNDEEFYNFIINTQNSNNECFNFISQTFFNSGTCYICKKQKMVKSCDFCKIHFCKDCEKNHNDHCYEIVKMENINLRQTIRDFKVDFRATKKLNKILVNQCKSYTITENDINKINDIKDLKKLLKRFEKIPNLVFLIRERIIKIADDKICKICMENQTNVLFLNCKHLCTCEKCSKKVENCPICRKKINEKLKIFFC